MSEPDFDLIARYLSGEATPAEESSFRQWLLEDPSRQVILQEARRAWDSAEPLGTSGRVDDRWNRLARRMAEARKPSFALRGPVLRIAAVIAVLASATLGYRLIFEPGSQVPVARIREAHTTNGQRLALRLPDGTRLVLGPASRIRYDSEAYGRVSRHIDLEGQAYFDVRHDSAAPFEVQAGSLLARDLGTRFTTRAFPGEPAQVAVAEGGVAIGSITIHPGQLGTLSGSGVVSVIPNPTPEAFFAWTQGRLVFRDTPLAEVVRQLERWYDLRFVLSDPSLGERPLTASFEAESASEALDLLAMALDLDVRRSGDAVTLRPRAAVR